MKCVWCNGRDGRLEEVAVEGFPGLDRSVWVHPEHRAEMVDTLERNRREQPSALIAIVCLPVLLAIAVPLSIPLGSPKLAAIVAGAGNVAIALLVWRYPFPILVLRTSIPTSQTVRWLGIRRSLAVIRGAAVVVALVGLWLIAGALWLDPL